MASGIFAGLPDRRMLIAMRAAAIQRFTAWLCLAAALWMGLAPAQTFVLCLEPDGSMDLELAVDGRCTGCGVSCRAVMPKSATCQDGGTTCVEEGCAPPTSHGQAAAAVDDGCPCIDLVLPTTGDDRIQPKPSQPDADHPVACAPAIDMAQGWPPAGARSCVTPAERPPPALALLRSVVLLI